MRTNQTIRTDIADVVQKIIDGEEGVAFPLLLEEAEDKVVACLAVLNKMHGEVAAGKVALETAASFIKRRQAAIARLETEITMTMEAMGENKIDRPDGKVTLVAGRAVLLVNNPESIPEAFWRVIPEKREVDKVPLLKAVQEGLQVPGVAIGTGNSSLRYPKPKQEVSE